MNKGGTPGNLTPFEPGDGWTGNAGGRPKKRPITDEYFALADVEIPKEICKLLKIKYVKGRTFSQANALQRYMDMLKKDGSGHRSAKEVREAMEGKAPQRVEISGPDQTVITLRILNDRKPPKSNG